VIRDQIQRHGILRLKGWLQQPGRPRPLQIQAVGPRLECWYESGPTVADAEEPRLELVVLGLRLDRDDLEAALLSTRDHAQAIPA
jgi:cobalamin biosynthesis protein CobW